MFSPADLQSHHLTYPGSSRDNYRTLEGLDIPDKRIGLYRGATSSEPASWRPPITRTRSPPSSSTPETGSSTEWDLGSISSGAQARSGDGRGLPSHPLKHSGIAYIGSLDVAPADPTRYTYEYSSTEYNPPYQLSAANEIYPFGLQEYSLCSPPEVSSVCLDHQQTRSQRGSHFQLYPNGQTPNETYTDNSPIYPTSISPTSTASSPYTNRMTFPSATPIPSNHFAQYPDGDDGEYLPGSYSKPKSRTAIDSKRQSGNRRRTSPSHPESTVQRHPCSFPSCPLAFARARDLKRHYRLHSGELPYICNGCSRGFIRSDARARHWKAQPECVANM